MSLAESFDAASLTKDLDPRDLIDRNAEQELFRGLVTYQTAARILMICDGGGRGKSSLLKRLRYNCEHEIKPAVLSCLLEIDKLGERDPSPFAFARAVVEGFTVRSAEVGARFGKFNTLNGARIQRSLTPFEDGGGELIATDPRLVGRALTGTMSGGKTIGVEYNVEHADTVQLPGRPEFTEDQEQRARERCVEALFDDLRSICAEHPLVLMLDGWERCNLTLREWIVSRVLASHVLHLNKEMRPTKLAVVIAGRPHVPRETPFGLRTDEFRQFFDSDDDFSEMVLSIRSLSEWESEHIREFMVLNGCPEPTEAQVTVIREMLSAGESLEKIVTLIDLLRPRRAGDA
jgi:hypothetical protein